MSKVDAKLIDRLDEVVAALFAPAITEGQKVTCYVDEEMTPYIIQGDNLPAANVIILEGVRSM